MYANLNYILLGFFKSRNLELMLKTQSNTIEISRISWQLPHSSLIGIPQIQIGIPQKNVCLPVNFIKKKKKNILFGATEKDRLTDQLWD